MEVNTNKLDFKIDMNDLKSRRYFEFPEEINLNRYVSEVFLIRLQVNLMKTVQLQYANLLID